MISRDNAIAELKRFWKVNELKFMAEFHRPKREDGTFLRAKKGQNDFGYFVKFSANDHAIRYPFSKSLKYDRRVSFKQEVLDGLEDGKYYLVELELEDDSNRQENPYLLRVKDIYILKDDHVPPKEFIQDWFYKKGRTPDDAATIAGQLSLNELELYTHTERFIFELVQNADDMPTGDKPVHINIELLHDYLLFLHNGKFFDREDVKAISDAAKSSKAKGLTQTGYKGIGFKSVFTDSTTVYIKSGDYTFKFDKHEPVYSDFMALYKGYYLSLSGEARREFEKEFKGREHKFTNIDQIPWQIKPIWYEYGSLDDQLKSSSFSKMHSVAIALRIENTVLKAKMYHSMINELLSRPRFLLFLRNTAELTYSSGVNQSGKGQVRVEVQRGESSLDLRVNGKLDSSFTKRDFEVLISNEAFVQSGVSFQKRELDNGKVEFFTHQGRKLRDIPEKLGFLEKSTVTLAALHHNSEIQRLREEESLLFNYLPTSDQRFGFPYLVNADFISSTNREFIHVENEWNHFLFYRIGRANIEWLQELASKTPETYLRLLPSRLLDEENRELRFINGAFNRGFQSGLEDLKFVLTDNEDLLNVRDIFLDDTGLIKVFGNGFISRLSGSSKCLPSARLDDQLLRKEYLSIDRYTGQHLIADLRTERGKELFVQRVLGSEESEYKAFLSWLSEFAHRERIALEWMLHLPFLRSRGLAFSLAEALKKEDYLLRSDRTKGIESGIERLGFVLSEINLSDSVNGKVSEAIATTSSYVTSDRLLYDHITSHAHFDSASPEERGALITFFASLDGVGPARYAQELALFYSRSNDKGLKPLRKLLLPGIPDLPLWLQEFQIDSIDFSVLSSDLKKELLQEADFLGQIFSKATFFKEVVAGLVTEDLESFYDYLLRLNALRIKERPDERLDFSGVPLVSVISDGVKFQLPEDTYWPDSLVKLSMDKYSSVKKVLQSLTGFKLPEYPSLGLKSAFKLGGLSLDISKEAQTECYFDVIALNDFLDWCESELNDGQFINQFDFSITELGVLVKRAAFGAYYFSEDPDVEEFIVKNDVESTLRRFPEALYSEGRARLGLLSGDHLLLNLIEKRLGENELSILLSRNTSIEVRKRFLESVESFEFSTGINYQKTSIEYRVVDVAVSVVSEDAGLVKSFRSKTVVDGNRLQDHAISSDVIFFKEQKKQGNLVVKLEEILPVYANSTFSVDNITRSFSELQCRVLFKQEHRGVRDIFAELHQTVNAEYFTPAQTLFLCLHAHIFEMDNPFMLRAPLFLDSWPKEKKEDAMSRFLNLVFKQFHFDGHLVGQSVFGEDFFGGINLNEDYRHLNEVPPSWVEGWLKEGGEEGLEERRQFLVNLGAIGDANAVNELRKALESESEFDNFKWTEITSSDLHANTIRYLHDIQTRVPGSMEKHKLKQVYGKAIELGLSLNDLPLPLRTDLSRSKYKIQDKVFGRPLYYISDSWSTYADLLLSHISDQEGVIIDDVLSIATLSEFDIVNGEIEVSLDTEVLSDRVPLAVPFFLEWSQHNELKVSVYNGELLPFKVTLNDILLGNILKNNAVVVEGELIICRGAEVGFPSTVREHLPVEDYNSLDVFKREFEKRRSEIHFSDEQLSRLNQIFDGDLPEDYRKNYNLSALIAAFEVLVEKGYDVAKARGMLERTHEYAQLSPVIDGHSLSALTFMARSARKGLLYMTQSAWDRLDDPLTYLFVDLGAGEYHIFSSKQDVLDVNDQRADYQIFRIEADAVAANVDAILRGNSDKRKIWMIFKVKPNDEFDPLFYKTMQPSTELTDNHTKMDSSRINYI